MYFSSPWYVRQGYCESIPWRTGYPRPWPLEVSVNADDRRGDFRSEEWERLLVRRGYELVHRKGHPEGSQRLLFYFHPRQIFGKVGVVVPHKGPEKNLTLGRRLHPPVAYVII